ncbi:MAG TPA: hypothetical protein VLM05_01640 [Mycobacteriales bacterium]|nr:hypothetical protein [Mycobacteriales bacterium]
MATLRAEREQEAAGRRRARWRLGIAVGVVLVALVGLLALAGGKPVPPGRSAYDAGTTDPVAAAVPVLAGFVEQARGLRFRTAPVVQVAPAATIAAAGKETAAADRSTTERALGFTGTAAPATPIAAYSYQRHAVVLRQGQTVDAYAQVVLVHELTKALQDQSFGVTGLTRAAAAEPDRARALSALVEGDATRVELAYLATLPGADQAAVRAKRDYSPTPTSYGQLAASFPATAGRDFAVALAEQGGNPAVDAAFRRPPESTAQVIDPKAYQAGTGPLGVRPPPGSGQRVDAGTLGQFGLAALVTGGRRVANAGAAGQWLGDSYGTFRSGRGLCTYANVVLADTASREQLVRDLARWVAGRGGKAEVVRSADRGIRLTSCA